MSNLYPNWIRMSTRTEASSKLGMATGGPNVLILGSITNRGDICYTAFLAEQSRLSNHLAVLRDRSLVRATRQGRQVIYELRDSAVGRLVESLGQIGGAPPRTAKSARPSRTQRRVPSPDR